MGLTKPRAAQIYNLDYKQSVRVVTVANITLTGGAPATVDGVNLSQSDRILVTGQTTGSQNGLYQVATVGTGSDGTWTRTNDGNDTGEIESGMIVMVTEGTVYKDTQWKLTTENPITIGTTTLVFDQNYSANSISAGSSNVSVLANANVTISSAGTANVLTISSTGTVTTGTASVTGNITGNYFIGNGSQLTGISGGGGANIANGTSNITIVSSGGNANVNIGGTANVAVFATTGAYVTGVVSATANITGGNILTGGVISATSTITSAANITGSNILTGGLISATGNVTGGNLLNNGLISSTGNSTAANYLTDGLISATANITGNYFIGNGSQLTGITATSGAGNLWVVGRLATYYVPIINSILNIVGRTGNISVPINT